MAAGLSDDEQMPLTRSIYDMVAPPDAEAIRWAQSVRDYAACHPSWRKVPGGRAVHAFMDGDTRPLCGIDAPNWVDGGSRRRRHSRCERLASAETSRRKTELFERQRREMPWEGP